MRGLGIGGAVRHGYGICYALDSTAGDCVLDGDFMTGTCGDEETRVPTVCECFSASPLLRFSASPLLRLSEIR